MRIGIYLFCLTPEKPLPEVTGTGIDGEHPLLVEDIGMIAAVFSEVNLEDFTGPEAQARLEDLAWIGPRALCHEEVIMAVMEHVPVLPVRFGTVFSSLEAMKEPLRRHRDTWSSFFRNTAGKKEWSIRAYVDRVQARSQIMNWRLAEEKGQLESLSPGKRYFLEQKIKGAVEREVTSWLKGISEDILNIVQEVSLSFSERRLLSREVTGLDSEMFFHGAFLVPDHSVDVLQGLTGDWNSHHEAQGLRLELSGPWPPYHFAPVLDMQG
ncbi:MAG: GvpL/GvpF family gas vesicle protein [Deltaproteobacteria bacterium]|nr:GvpL/GvpF family gas vesicle protein [Deltaproteobacteria bacterium]